MFFCEDFDFACSQIVVDEQALDVLVWYCVRALHACSPWTHTEVLLALSSVLYANGARCQRVRRIPISVRQRFLGSVCVETISYSN